MNEDKYWEDFKNGKSLKKYGDKAIKKWEASPQIAGDLFFKRMQYENKYDLDKK
jgi:hypothetical protein